MVLNCEMPVSPPSYCCFKMASYRCYQPCKNCKYIVDCIYLYHTIFNKNKHLFLFDLFLWKGIKCIVIYGYIYNIYIYIYQ